MILMILYYFSDKKMNVKKRKFESSGKNVYTIDQYLSQTDENDKLHGPVIFINENNKIVCIATYNHGIPHGLAVDFSNENDKIASISTYNYGVFHGLVVDLNNDDLIIENFKNGKNSGFTIYQNRKKSNNINVTEKMPYPYGPEYTINEKDQLLIDKNKYLLFTTTYVNEKDFQLYLLNVKLMLFETSYFIKDITYIIFSYINILST